MLAILVPVKSFRDAKHRLHAALSNAARASLARALAARVVHAAGSVPVYVACDDGEVADWSIGEGARVLFTPGRGLSGAVRAGVGHLCSEGFSRVVVAHADLPFASRLDRFGNDREITIAPDRRLDGTNVISVPSAIDFAFSYGAGSYERHRALAAACGLPCRTVFDWRLASDVDRPEDLPLVTELIESEVAHDGES